MIPNGFERSPLVYEIVDLACPQPDDETKLHTVQSSSWPMPMVRNRRESTLSRLRGDLSKSLRQKGPSALPRLLLCLLSELKLLRSTNDLQADLFLTCMVPPPNRSGKGQRKKD